MNEEGREKIRVTHLGTTHYVSEETCKKISESLKGKPLSQKYKDSTSKSVKELWKDPLYREMQRESRKGRVCHKICKICGREFESQAMNARYCSDNCRNINYGGR